MIRLAYRYLGYRGGMPDESVQRAVDAAFAMLRAEARPLHGARRYALEARGDGAALAGQTIASQALATHLSGCESAYALVFTLGFSADALIARESALSQATGAVLHACAAAMLEAYADEICAGIGERLRRENLFLMPRFSPGYGDFSLTYQPLMLALSGARAIGVCETDSHQLTPVKSITAVAGVTRDARRQCVGKCAACGAQCAFREEENDADIRR